MASNISFRYATEEDYKRLDSYQIGTFHRALSLPVTDPSSGEGQAQSSAPQGPGPMQGAADIIEKGLRVISDRYMAQHGYEDIP